MATAEYFTLEKAQPGTNYFIVENTATGRTHARLDSLGLVSGEAIRVLYANFAGFVISIKGSRLALSRGVAKGLVVTPTQEAYQYHRVHSHKNHHVHHDHRDHDNQHSLDRETGLVHETGYGSLSCEPQQDKGPSPVSPSPSSYAEDFPDLPDIDNGQNHGCH